MKPNKMLKPPNADLKKFQIYSLKSISTQQNDRVSSHDCLKLNLFPSNPDAQRSMVSSDKNFFNPPGNDPEQKVMQVVYERIIEDIKNEESPKTNGRDSSILAVKPCSLLPQGIKANINPLHIAESYLRSIRSRTRQTHV